MSITQLHRSDTLAPTPAPLRGTLLDAVGLTSGIARSETVDLFESYNTIMSSTAAVFPCPVSTLSAPVQSAATTATTGGTLAAGTYLAVVTAINSRGETVKSNEISRVTTGSTSTITWNWAAVTGATGYNIYVTALGGATGTETLLVTLGTVTTYVWTGTPARGTATPPTVNTAVVPVTKNFDQSPNWQDGFKFANYIGMVCKAVGYDSGTAMAELERVFAAQESKSIAQAFMAQRFITAGDWTAATDITPAAGAVDPSVALAMLEGYAGWHYTGVPVIHATRTIGSLMTRNGQAGFNGDVLVSSLGTPIAAEPGYEVANTGPTGAAAATGEQWTYVSGAVTIIAGEPISQQVLDYSEAGDSNRVKTLRERPYMAMIDGFTAAIRTKVQ